MVNDLPTNNSDPQNTSGLSDLGSSTLLPTVPTNPENPPVEKAIPQETFSYGETEKLISLEDLKVPEALAHREQQTTQGKQNYQDTSEKILSTPSKPVVDKTSKITQLHHLNKPADSLTQKADEEEEHFIEEVEKHHGTI